MKSSVKNVTQYVKETKFIAISFNPDGSRGTHYGGGNPLMILNFISAAAKSGMRALLFSADFDYRKVYRPELEMMKNSAESMRDPKFYETVLPYAVSSANFYY